MQSAIGSIAYVKHYRFDCARTTTVFLKAFGNRLVVVIPLYVEHCKRNEYILKFGCNGNTPAQQESAYIHQSAFLDESADSVEQN